MADGRYGNIRVYTGSAWAQPTEIKVYDGSNWISLGTNSDQNNRTLRPYNTSWTGNRLQKSRSITDYTYSEGRFQLPTLSTASGDPGNWCLVPQASIGNREHHVTCTIYKTENTAKTIFINSDGGNALSNANNGHEIVWLADGRIQVNMKYVGNSIRSLTTSNAVTAGNWVSLNVSWAKGTGKLTITFNGVTTTSTNIATYVGINKQAYCGADGLRFKDTLDIVMTRYRYTSFAEDHFNATASSGSMGTVHAVTHTEWYTY